MLYISGLIEGRLQIRTKIKGFFQNFAKSGNSSSSNLRHSIFYSHQTQMLHFATRMKHIVYHSILAINLPKC